MRVIAAPLFFSLCLASIQARADRVPGDDLPPVDTLVDPAAAAMTSPAPATLAPIKGNFERRQGLFDFFKTTTSSILQQLTDQNMASSLTQTATVSAPSTSDNPLANPIIIVSIVIACLAFLGITLALICFRHTLFPRSFSELENRRSIHTIAGAADTHKPYQEIPYKPLVNPLKRLRAKKVVFQYTAAANSNELSVEIGDLVDVTDVVDDNFFSTAFLTAILLAASVHATIVNMAERKSSLQPIRALSNLSAKLAAIQPPTESNPSNASTAPAPPANGLSGGAVAGIAIGGCVAVVAVVGGVFGLQRRNRFNNGVTGIEGGYSKVKTATTPTSSLVMRSVVKGFTPMRDDELTLFIGDQVRVVERHDDGWGRGIVKRTEGEGYFPLSVIGEK
ncbi:hypothetical protein BJ741DRAFT_707781 [Chytriomyces cf. hyalinus JEL632]|nr:hypothetical protein BJ741DRAFT_707781 [Chytriomyces cf. hyalinus JEL632]